MIRHLTLNDVGPTRRMEFDFAPRLNVLTGDNGLGKTFVLDVLWWVLTTTWAGGKAFPWRPPEVLDRSSEGPRGDDAEHQISPAIQARLAELWSHEPSSPGFSISGQFDRHQQEWIRYPRPMTAEDRRLLGDNFVVVPEEAHNRRPALVLYARNDGSYAVWDAYYAGRELDTYAEAAIVLTGREVLDGKTTSDPLAVGGRRTVIGGLVADWVSWQQRVRSHEFDVLRGVLLAISPPGEPLIPASPTRVELRDRRDIPALATEHGVVPVTLASSGFRRALSLAYLLVWAWTEHINAANLAQREPTRDVVLLVDEPELHQHPAWQRVFVPALLKAAEMVAPGAQLQVFLATHSPLVLASLESVFSDEQDDLFVLERDGRAIRANELPFGKEGDVSNWLASDVFGGVGARSREGELAVRAAMDFMAGRHEEAEERLRALGARFEDLPGASAPDLAPKARRLPERIHDALKRTLPGHDEFWPQWTLAYRPPRGPRRRNDAAR